MTKFVCTKGQVLLMAIGDLNEISQDAMCYNITLLKDLFKKTKDLDLVRSFALTIMQDMRDTLEDLEGIDIDDEDDTSEYDAFNDFLSTLQDMFPFEDNDDDSED